MRRSHHHAKYDLKYHLVLVSKYRKKVFTKDILIRLEEIMRDICTKWDVELIEFGGESDHVHMLISAHPSMELSKFTNNIKTVSSRYIRKEFDSHVKKYLWGGALWKRGYFIISSGGAPIDKIREYIQNQDTPSS